MGSEMCIRDRLYNTLKENLIQKGIITSDELKAASLIEEVE